MIKTILITGAGTGFGKGTALKLLKLGHKIIAGLETLSQATEVENDIKKQKLARSRITFIKLDITNAEDIKRASTYTIDILINNAGILWPAPLYEQSIDDIKKVMDVNFFGQIALTQAFTPQFLKRRNGKIVFTVSIVSLVGYPYIGAYCASKFALEGAVEALYEELKPFGIKVCTIMPSAHNTGLNENSNIYLDEWYKSTKNHSVTLKHIKNVRNVRPENQKPKEEIIDAMVRVCEKDDHPYRICLAKDACEFIKKDQKEMWTKKC